MDPSLRLATVVIEKLNQRNVSVAVIGAVAMAFRGFVRATTDIDLVVDLRTFPDMKRLAEELAALGQVDFRFGDEDDPIGAVIDVQSPTGGHVQILSFRGNAESSPRFALDLIEQATSVEQMPDSLKFATFKPLVASKVYAGGNRAAWDVAELLKAQTEFSLSDIQAYCQEVGLSEDWERMSPKLEAFLSP